MNVTLRLPWPAPPLWQNRRCHYMQRARATDYARRYAQVVMHEAMQRHRVQAGAEQIVLTFAFHPPDNRRRDLVNLPATQKAAIDGIADALRVDDSTFVARWPEAWAGRVTDGAVVVEVSGLVAREGVR